MSKIKYGVFAERDRNTYDGRSYRTLRSAKSALRKNKKQRAKAAAIVRTLPSTTKSGYKMIFGSKLKVRKFR
jgi:hypothetical protein